jgi:hypothetical protein
LLHRAHWLQQQLPRTSHQENRIKKIAVPYRSDDADGASELRAQVSAASHLDFDRSSWGFGSFCGIAMLLKCPSLRWLHQQIVRCLPMKTDGTEVNQPAAQTKQGGVLHSVL